MDWVAAGFRAVGWQAKHRAWQMARWFFHRIGRPLPRSLRYTTRLMGEAADKDATSSYPGRITLLRSSQSTFTRYERWDLGWGRIAVRGVDVHEIAGLKRALMRANVTEVGLRLKECLDRAQQSHIAEIRRLLEFVLSLLQLLGHRAISKPGSMDRQAGYHAMPSNLLSGKLARRCGLSSSEGLFSLSSNGHIARANLILHCSG